MATAEEQNRYFTAQIVGQARQIEMGPSEVVRRGASEGVLASWVDSSVALTRAAVGDAIGQDNATATNGRPMPLHRLPRLGWRLLGLAMLAWTLVVVLACVVVMR